MDVLSVLIVLAFLATLVAVILGLVAMSGGGATDKALGTPLMWTRIGLQALTLLLLAIAVLAQWNAR